MFLAKKAWVDVPLIRSKISPSYQFLKIHKIIKIIVFLRIDVPTKTSKNK